MLLLGCPFSEDGERKRWVIASSGYSELTVATKLGGFFLLECLIRAVACLSTSLRLQDGS